MRATFLTTGAGTDGHVGLGRSWMKMKRDESCPRSVCSCVAPAGVDAVGTAHGGIGNAATRGRRTPSASTGRCRAGTNTEHEEDGGPRSFENSGRPGVYPVRSSTPPREPRCKASKAGSGDGPYIHYG
jgi:hypothetical protein